MPETPAPLVTVLMPVRNGADHVRAAIESILAQTFADFELLIIDDGSSDATPELLRSFVDRRIRIVTHPRNIGLVPTLNEGLELARGAFIARQDHDDISHPERLRTQVDYLSRHPQCALLGTEAFATIGDEDRAYRLLRPAGVEAIRWYLCFDNAFIHSAVMFRRDVLWKEHGGYPRSLHSEDYALWSQVAAGQEVGNLLVPLLRYREHASSVTASMNAETAAAFDAATQEIRWQNLHALFGEQVSMEDARILSTYRRNFSAASAHEFLGVFDRLADLYSAQVKGSVEFRRIMAIQLAELGYRLLTVDRWLALSLYRRAFMLAPSVARLLPWSRIAALFLLGDRAREWYLRFFGGT